jgi:hypothetical protein
LTYDHPFTVCTSLPGGRGLGHREISMGTWLSNSILCRRQELKRNMLVSLVHNFFRQLVLIETWDFFFFFLFLCGTGDLTQGKCFTTELHRLPSTVGLWNCSFSRKGFGCLLLQLFWKISYF